MEYIIGLIVAMGGGIFYLFTQNNKLKSDKKLSDVEIENAKLETKQGIASEQAKVLTEMLDKIKPEDVPNESAEDFWKKRDGK